MEPLSFSERSLSTRAQMTPAQARPDPPHQGGTSSGPQPLSEGSGVQAHPRQDPGQDEAAPHLSPPAASLRPHTHPKPPANSHVVTRRCWQKARAANPVSPSLWVSSPR